MPKNCRSGTKNAYCSLHKRSKNKSFDSPAVTAMFNLSLGSPCFVSGLLSPVHIEPGRQSFIATNSFCPRRGGLGRLGLT